MLELAERPQTVQTPKEERFLIHGQGLQFAVFFAGNKFQLRRKPDPAIFQIALERLGNPAPERSLFLDDYAGNIEVATKLGFRSLLVGTDPEKTLSELDEILAG